MTARILGLTGRAGSGKSVSAAMIAPYSMRFGLEDGSTTHVPLKCPSKRVVLRRWARAVALADPIKQIAASIWRFSDEQIYGPSEARNAPDTRYPRDCVTCRYARSWDGRGRPPSNDDLECTACSGTGITYLSPREALQKLGTDIGRLLYEGTWTERLFREIERRASQQVNLWVITDVRFDNEAKAIRDRGGVVWQIERPGAVLDGEAARHTSELGINPALVSRRIVNDKALDDLYAKLRSALIEDEQ